MTEQISPPSRRSGWMFLGIAALSTLLGAAGLYSPHPVGIVLWPRVALFVLVALACVICFLLCPRRPFAPKFLTFVLMFYALIWAVVMVVYRWLNFVNFA